MDWLDEMLVFTKTFTDTIENSKVEGKQNPISNC